MRVVSAFTLTTLSLTGLCTAQSMPPQPYKPASLRSMSQQPTSLLPSDNPQQPPPSLRSGRPSSPPGSMPQTFSQPPAQTFSQTPPAQTFSQTPPAQTFSQTPPGQPFSQTRAATFSQSSVSQRPAPGKVRSQSQSQRYHPYSRQGPTQALASQGSFSRPAQALPSRRILPRRVIKPHMAEVFTGHMLVFVPPTGHEKTCQEVIDDMAEASRTNTQMYVALDVVISVLQGDLDSQADKNVMTALKQYGTFSSSQDEDIDYLKTKDELMKCKINKERGWGIIQTMVVNGMSMSLESPLINDMYQGGIGGYDPSLELDNDGNTYVHLAAKYQHQNMLEILIGMEQEKNKAHEDRRMNAIFWILSAFLHRNNEGKRPLDLCAQTAFQQELKNKFRLNTYYLKLKMKKAGVVDESLQDTLDSADRVLEQIPSTTTYLGDRGVKRSLPYEI